MDALVSLSRNLVDADLDIFLKILSSVSAIWVLAWVEGAGNQTHGLLHALAFDE